MNLERWCQICDNAFLHHDERLHVCSRCRENAHAGEELRQTIADNAFDLGKEWERWVEIWKRGQENLGRHRGTAYGHIRSIQGTVVWMRDETPRDWPCQCCLGPHVFCRFLKTSTGENDADWLHKVISTLPEGAQVLITVEAKPKGADGE